MSDSAQIAFPGVRGHARAQAKLSRAIERDQLHHGLLFIGPEGVGRATVARGLGCALHCKVRPGVGCGECNDCHLVLTGNHGGVEWVRPEGPGGMIKAEPARLLANRLMHAPFEGDRHLVVFDPGHAVNETAFNALLKSIEEPAPGVHFVFIVTNTESLLPTIVSRCLPVRFGTLAEDDLATVLGEELARRRATAEAEGEEPPQVPDDRRTLAMRLAQGSAGAAVELAMDDGLDQALSLLSHAMAAADVGPPIIFGGDKSPLWEAWTEAYGGSGPGRPARERAACARLTELWLLDLGSRLRGAEGLPGLSRRVHRTGQAAVRELDLLLSLRDRLDRNPNVRLALEQTLLELSACRPPS